MHTVSSIFNGKLNIQINNAGMNIRKPTVQYTAEEFSTIMAIKFDSVYHICQLAHPFLKAAGAGSIVFMSSAAGVVSLNYVCLWCDQRSNESAYEEFGLQVGERQHQS